MDIIKKIVIVCMMACCLSGCAILQHLQEILTLKSFSQEKDEQDKIIKKRKENYEALKQAVLSGDMSRFKDTKGLTAAFGNPVLIKTIQKDGQAVDRWLYRQETIYKITEKVYVYVDTAGQLIGWEYVPQTPQ